MTDQYELTIPGPPPKEGTPPRHSVFEVFARRLPNGRRYGVVAGHARLMEMVAEFRFGPAEIDFLTSAGIVDAGTAEWLSRYRFSGDIDGYAEGELYFPGS